MKTGMTFEVLSIDGKIPVTNDIFTSYIIGLEMLQARTLRILTGILLGPVDFETEKDLTMPMTSSWDTGDKNIENLDFTKIVKNDDYIVEGISNLLLFATELKKSLKDGNFYRISNNRVYQH